MPPVGFVRRLVSLRAPLAAALIALVTAVGCGDDGGGNGNGSDAGPGTGGDAATEPGGEGAACDDMRPCAGDLLCAGGECARPEGPCSNDSECDGDTYCCTGDCLPPGEDAGQCIPYGSGDRDEVNPMCVGEVVVGLFQADDQCEWSGPPDGDAYPDHIQVLTTPMVADLPHDSGAAAEMLVVSYNFTDGSTQSGYGSDPAYYGVLRVLSGQDCSQLESIADPDNPIIAATPPAIGDLDGDGVPEIVTHRAGSGVIAFSWNAAQSRYERLWVSTASDISNTIRWDGPAIHDLNDDGKPEVVSAGEVYDGATGARLNPGQVIGGGGYLAVVGDLEGDGSVELVHRDVHRWNTATNTWDNVYEGAPGGRHFAFADFGTQGDTPEDFDPSVFDGIAEVVATGDNVAYLATLDGQVLLSVTTGIAGGGPPTVGDFDNDGRPEFAAAGGNFYRVFDLDCAGGASAECAGTFVRWEKASQDLSSSMTGSSIFDFEGDGKAEAVYADECFTRIYDGSDGQVLYSAFRTSCTWYENPVVADPDQDQNTEILVGSNANCNIACPEVDPIHPGIACESAADCVSGVCDGGYCRCTGDDQCDPGYVCRAPLAGTPGAGNTCRAHHPPGVGITGLRVLRDRLDRWASSRPLWNQHAYSVTNVNDDLTIPRTSQWLQNFLQAGLNNFRQNVQGAASATDQPDITGRIGDDVCRQDGATTRLVATVCNRGLRTVGAAMPATFYAGSVAPENVLCTSYTSGPVPVGECLEVSCELAADVEGEVILVVNDDGMGGRATVECIDDNNEHATEIEACHIID